MPPFPQTSFPDSRFTPQVNDLTTTVRSGDSLRNQTHTYYPKFSSKHQRHSDRETKPVVTDGVQDSTYLLLSCTSQDPATGALQGGNGQQHCRLAQLITASSESSAAAPQSTLPKAGVTAVLFQRPQRSAAASAPELSSSLIIPIPTGLIETVQTV